MRGYVRVTDDDDNNKRKLRERKNYIVQADNSLLSKHRESPPIGRIENWPREFVTKDHSAGVLVVQDLTCFTVPLTGTIAETFPFTPPAHGNRHHHYASSFFSLAMRDFFPPLFGNNIPSAWNIPPPPYHRSGPSTGSVARCIFVIIAPPCNIFPAMHPRCTALASSLYQCSTVLASAIHRPLGGTFHVPPILQFSRWV